MSLSNYPIKHYLCSSPGFGFQPLLSSSQLDQVFKTQLTIEEVRSGLDNFNDLKALTHDTDSKIVESIAFKYGGITNSLTSWMKQGLSEDDLCQCLAKANAMMEKAWQNPFFGHNIGSTLCDVLR